MTLSEQLREAAIGPTPREPQYLFSWVASNDDEVAFADVDCIIHYSDRHPLAGILNTMTDEHRRTFLLLMAEVLE
jgi:hypothetical protein